MNVSETGGLRVARFVFGYAQGMEADDDDRPFVLKWSRTFPDTDNDFTGRDPQRPTAFAQVYFQPSHPDPKRRWFWTASVTYPGDGT